MAIGEGATPLPGNLALGATRSSDLARQAGEVLGRELAAFPEAQTYLSTNSVQTPSIRALAQALFEPARIHRRLPVSIPSLYRAGFGMFG